MIGPLATPAHAQTAVVGACSGVSLPRSVVTDIASQILTPTFGTLESVLSALLPINLGLSTAVANAAAGQPITLNALDLSGNAINVVTSPTCVSQSDIFELETEKGISFGGNQITGLGTRGRNANAGALTAIAIGDLASTGAGLGGAIAIGESASVTGGTASIALGRNSIANGLTLATPAYLVGGTATSELAIGGRRITGVAAGAAPTDAVNVAQLQAAASAISGDALLYDGVSTSYNATRGGAATRVTGVAAGTVAAGSTDAVNGSQLAATNTAVTNVDARVTTVDNRVTNVDNRVTGLTQDALLFDGVAGAYSAQRGGVSQKISGVAAGTVAAGSTDAVNGSQLDATNTTVTNVDARVTTVDNRVTNVDNRVTGLTQDALLFDGVAGAYSAQRGGVSQKISGVAAGTVAAGSTDAVNGSQLDATNTAVTNVDARVTNVDGRVTNVDNRVTNIDNSVTGLQQDALLFDGAAGAYTASRGGAAQRITGVADGAVVAGSSDAVNGGQLAATNAQVTTNTTNIAGNTTVINQLGVDLAGLDAVAVRYDGVAGDSVTFRGASGTRLSNVAAGTADTDAVNLAQLNAVAGVAGDALGYDIGEAAYSAARGGVATRITNVADGTLSATSDDAVNGAQLFATNQRVATNETNITNVDGRVTSLTTNIDAGTVGPVRYASAADPSVPSGAGPSQNLALVGAAAGPVGLGNVAAGPLAAGSTAAVNGGQVFGMGTSVANAIGGGSSFNAGSGQVVASLNYGGTSYGSVQGAISAIETSVSNITSGESLTYFNTNSTGADSRALGADSTAIGVNAVAMGDGSIAQGRSAWAQDDGAVAIGDGAQAAQGKAVSIGFANVAQGDGAVSIGDPNIATGNGAVALGRDNQATGDGSVALGDVNIINGAGSVGLGARNRLTGVAGIAIGSGNDVTGNASHAFGDRNVVVGDASLALGSNNRIDGGNSIAIGGNIVTQGVNTLAIGNNAVASADEASAFGNNSQARGLSSTAIGTFATAGTLSSALGDNSSALGAASAAFGALTQASGAGSVAIGTGAVVTVDGSVALGSASIASRGGVSGYGAFGLGAAQTSVGEVAIAQLGLFPDQQGNPIPRGERQITGLAAGSADTDAVNVAQLRGATAAVGVGLATSLGGGSSYNPVTGVFTAPSYTIGGVTYTNVGDALANVGSGTGGGGVTPNAVAYDSATRDQITLGGTAGTRITNVTAGQVASGSTDAVNGGQLYDVSTRVSQLEAAPGGGGPAPLVYSDISGVPTPGIVTNTATLVGTAPGQAVTLRNVGGGSVTAGSTDAVNGGQLFAAQQGTVRYDRAADGSTTDRISLAGGSGGPVTIGNVAAGVSPTDAVNLGQLGAGLNQALASANSYTDARVLELRSSLGSLRRDGEAATAAAMALGTVPQAYGPGMGVFGMGVSAWGGESAIALGASKVATDGRFMFKAGATYNTRGKGGAAFGAGFGF